MNMKQAAQPTPGAIIATCAQYAHTCLSCLLVRGWTKYLGALLLATSLLEAQQWLERLPFRGNRLDKAIWAGRLTRGELTQHHLL